MIWCLIVIFFSLQFFNQLMMGILGFIIVFMATSYLRPSEEWGNYYFIPDALLKKRFVW